MTNCKRLTAAFNGGINRFDAGTASPKMRMSPPGRAHVCLEKKRARSDLSWTVDCQIATSPPVACGLEVRAVVSPYKMR
jgi:hypothetical protein